MKRLLILGAVGILLTTHASTLILVSRNRSDTRGGTIELTERELRLPRTRGESTALFLELEWDMLPAYAERDRWPRWLDAEKLVQLGFDCHLPVTHPHARAYYDSLTSKLVFLVLEYEGEAWMNADPNRRQHTRLFAIDAGQNPLQLRTQYPAPDRFIITRCLVSVVFQDYQIPGGDPLPQPRPEMLRQDPLQRRPSFEVSERHSRLVPKRLEAFELAKYCRQVGHGLRG